MSTCEFVFMSFRYSEIRFGLKERQKQKSCIGKLKSRNNTKMRIRRVPLW